MTPSRNVKRGAVEPKTFLLDLPLAEELRMFGRDR